MDTPTVLYWNERGAIACEKHIPFKGSDTWVFERWAKMSGIDKVKVYSHRKETLPARLVSMPSCECCQ